MRVALRAVRPVVGDVDLAAENRLDSLLSGLPVELDRAGERAVVGERDRRHLELGGPRGEVRDPARAVEDRVLGVDVEMDERRIGHGRPILPALTTTDGNPDGVVLPGEPVAATRAARASQRNHMTLAARTAAPSPMTLTTTLAAIDTGIAPSVGIHTARHSGRRLNAKASTSGAKEERRALMPDSIPCASACHEVFVAGRRRCRGSRGGGTPRGTCPTPEDHRARRRRSARARSAPSARHRPSAKTRMRSPLRFVAIRL